MPMTTLPSAGAVRIRTALVGSHTDLADTVRALTMDALDPPSYAALPQLVDVQASGEQIVVTLREPLAGFALGHGCRTVSVHGHINEGAPIVTVVLTRHPAPLPVSSRR